MPAFLHASKPMRDAMGEDLHPGGPELTRRGLHLAQAGHEDSILDAGCGAGGSLRCLHDWGYGRALGLDRDLGLLAGAGRNPPAGLVAGDITCLPLTQGCMDIVLCQCVWNLSNRAKALAQFQRVLRPGGRLILSDIYQRAAPQSRAVWPLECCLAGAAPRERTLELVTGAGFIVKHWEDHSAALRQLAGELILAHGSLQGFWRAVTGDPNQAGQACRAGRSSLPGLFLCIAEKA